MQLKLLLYFVPLLPFQATSLSMPESPNISEDQKGRDTALPHATQQNSTTAPSLPFNNLTLPSASDPRLRCAHRPLLPFTPDLRPHLNDCTFAIGILPFTHTPGTFHSGYPPNQFGLPLRRIVGSCFVEVELKDPSAKVRSSWFEIRAAVQHLNIECRVKKRGGTEVTGGVSEVGEENGIRVRLKSTGARYGDIVAVEEKDGEAGHDVGTERF